MAVTNATMVMGDSGSGKSSLLATLAEWGWKKHKKVSLLYSTDGGGFPSKLDALIRAGIVRVWKLRTRGEAFESCSRACQGYWPVEFTDPLAGETPPGVKLVPSIVTTYTLHCGKCEAEVAKRPNRREFTNVQICPSCQGRVNLKTGYVEEDTVVSKFFENVGIVMYDGLTSMNDWIMGDMADKTAKGQLRGESAMGVLVSGDMSFGSSTRNHYGFAQVRSAQWLQDATNIQGLVIGPVFTARKQRAVDANSQIRVYGPQIAGQAKTSDVPAWVGNCLGATNLIDEKGRKEWRLYLTEYREPNDDILHLCKTRAAPGTMPDFLSDGPIDRETNKPANGSESFTHFNLGYFMDLMESATDKTLKETMEAYPDAPGLDYLETMAEDAKTAEPEKVAAPQPAKPAGRPTPPAKRQLPAAKKPAASKKKPVSRAAPVKKVIRRAAPKPGQK